MEKPTCIIAIDGTSASGKGTLARALAGKLGFACLDTGKLYRFVGWRMAGAGADVSDEALAGAWAVRLKDEITPDALADPALKTDVAGQAASKVSVHPGVRRALFDLQKDFAARPPGGARGAVLDGRDIGTVICPDAPLKLYITATPEIRAQRRFKELQSVGIPATYEAVLAEMRERDARDSGRDTAPLKPATDAVILDTTDMKPEGALEAALAHVVRVFGNSILRGNE